MLCILKAGEPANHRVAPHMAYFMLHCNRAREIECPVWLPLSSSICESHPRLQFAVASQNQISAMRVWGNIMTLLRSLLFILASFALASCQTAQPSLNMSIGAVKIESLEVSQAASVPVDSEVTPRVKAYAQYRLGKQSAPNGRAVRVAIFITELHRKNPAMSLLAGDSNRITAAVTVSDVTGKPLMQREVSAMNSVIINGVIGAVAAAASDKGETDDELADALAENVERTVFGRALAGRLKLPPAPAPSAMAQ
jgi:hypothetical protein